MHLFYLYSIAYGIFIAILYLIIKRCYDTLKIYLKFPIAHLISSLIEYHLTRKVPQVIPFNSFLFQKIIEACKKYKKEGLVMTYSTEPTLIIYSEEAIKVFSNEKIAGDKSREYEFVKEVFGPGLIVSSGERWKKHRKMMNPSFQPMMLKERVPLFNEYASALIKDLETLADVPSHGFLDLIKYHYFTALSESVFGLKQCDENKAANYNYVQLIDKLTSAAVYRFAHPWLQWKIFRYISPHERKYFKMKNDLFLFTKKVITEMEKLPSTNKTEISEFFGQNMRKSLTYILLQHHLNDPLFTLEDLHGEVSNVMFAGFDTVSYSTMWSLFMLGLYPEVQEKAFNEVNSIPQEYISYEDCCGFAYLESVIMETMRLYPTIPLFLRKTKQDVQFGKYTVPKGISVCFTPIIYHRNPDIYPNPEKFDPERFFNKPVRKTWTHIPFAEGNRTCIGKKYALIEMKIFLAYILRNFKITSLDKREDVDLCYNIVLTPVKPLRMQFSSRSLKTLS